jgi:hypothetical protein
MELLLKCDELALADASNRLIDLVDQVLRRHPGKAKPRRKLFYGFSGLAISTARTSQSYSSNSAILQVKTNAQSPQIGPQVGLYK